MKIIITFLFILIPVFLFGQSYHCTHKMSEFAMWVPASVEIFIAENVIEVTEVEGVTLLISFDTKEKFQGATYYKFKGTMRTVVPYTAETRRIITVMSNNYICPNTD